MILRGKNRITVHLNDGTDRTMVVSEIRVEADDSGQGVIATFGRNDGHGFRPFMSAPLASITSWDYTP